MTRQPTLFTDFLTELGVPYTYGYSAGRFSDMPFKSLFGLSKLLQEYGIESAGYNVSPQQLLRLDTPFIAATRGGLVIVSCISPDGQVCYLSQGQPECISADEFGRLATGDVFMAFPTQASHEPDYAAHRRVEIIDSAKKYALAILAAALFVYLFVTNGIFRHVPAVLVTLFDLVGLTFSVFLLQKTLKLHNPAADDVCKFVEEGGCDSVLETRASSFYGIFNWSEVGFTYFSVSLLCLLVFPDALPWLALCNLCCLPFSFWSVWYQKFRAKAWCTLCLGVQATLWILFFCYLGGGYLRDLFPLRMPLFVLMAVYATVLLATNALVAFYNRKKNENQTNT